MHKHKKIGGLGSGLAITAGSFLVLSASCGSALKFASSGPNNSASATSQPEGEGQGASGASSGENGAGKASGHSGPQSVKSFKLGFGSDSLLGYQGILPTTADEELTQQNQASGLLDILIVIDNSASMAEEQRSLSAKLSALFVDPRIQVSDWQIGVVTTDPNDPAFKNVESKCLRTIIRKSDGDIDGKFKAAIEAGTSGDNTERGILNAVKGLKSECLGGKSWLRDNSTVAVLFVSDEDNCSNGSDVGCDGQPDRQSKYLTDYLGKIRVLGEEARIYGILWGPAVPALSCSTGFNRGNIYAEAIAASKGSWGSICDGDYAPILANLSKDISTIIRNQFNLKLAPPPGAFSVSIDGQLQTGGYKVVGKTLTFTTPPAVGSKIKIVYDRAKTPMINSLAVPPDAVKVLQVAIDGAAMDGSAWTYDGAAHQVSFAVAPAEGSQIRITFQRPGDIAGSQIALSGPIDLATLDIRMVSSGAKVEWKSVDSAACAKPGSCLIDLKNPENLPMGTEIEAKYY